MKTHNLNKQKTVRLIIKFHKISSPNLTELPTHKKCVQPYSNTNETEACMSNEVFETLHLKIMGYGEWKSCPPYDAGCMDGLVVIITTFLTCCNGD